MASQRSNVPAVRVNDEIDQPLLVDGHPVSFWHTVTGGEPTSHTTPTWPACSPHSMASAAARATWRALLRSRSLESRLAAPTAVTREDRDFLLARCGDLNEQLGPWSSPCRAGPIHGDAHTRNLLTDHGQVVLLDFESAAVGPREWDLLPTAIACGRYGLPEEQYQEFAAAYGFDVRAWPGYPVLREVRQLRMTTWIMQNVGESPAVAAEFALRVASLRERDFDVPGTSSDQPAAARPGGQHRQRVLRSAPDPDHQHRTPRPGTWPTAPRNGDLPGYLRLWRFERYYRLSADQLPAVLHPRGTGCQHAAVPALAACGTLTGARIWLFACPRDRSWPRSAWTRDAS